MCKSFVNVEKTQITLYTHTLGNALYTTDQTPPRTGTLNKEKFYSFINEFFDYVWYELRQDW